MDGNHPKRRKDKYNPYRIAQENDKFFVSFKDGVGVLHSLEIDEDLYDLLNIFELEDLSYLNVWDRHIEQAEQTEVSLHRRTIQKNTSVEDAVISSLQSEDLHKAIAALPQVQRRRLLLYFFGGLTYEQIAEKEGCTKMPVKRSIDRAIMELQKIFFK